MSRFNFTELLLTGKADITDVMNNFNKIEELGITNDEVDKKIETSESNIQSNTDTKLKSYTKTTELGKLALATYSRGTAAPSGGKDGDIYDQYFN